MTHTWVQEVEIISNELWDLDLLIPTFSSCSTWVTDVYKSRTSSLGVWRLPQTFWTWKHNRVKLLWTLHEDCGLFTSQYRLFVTLLLFVRFQFVSQLTCSYIYAKIDPSKSKYSKLRQPLDFGHSVKGQEAQLLGFLQFDWWKSTALSTFGHSVKRPRPKRPLRNPEYYETHLKLEVTYI
jgi:hypothetical protein